MSSLEEPFGLDGLPSLSSIDPHGFTCPACSSGVEDMGMGSRRIDGGNCSPSNNCNMDMMTYLNDWIIDSGASEHVCCNIRAFNYTTPMEAGEHQMILVGDHRPLPVISKGQVILKLASNNILVLNDVLYVPNMRRNLMSVSSLGKTGIRVLFDFDKIFLMKNNICIGKGYCYQGLYLLEGRQIFNNNAPRI
ncbi:hypothetical protein PVL29_007933 [Vitis rotundifolia]|uniref:Retrovirus-related Pol polyprotein from transposon TNT 1-94-like beta-barrel domain-containing protein n=1 Tax=Vitis rotundifolia TaxID=103349 RepID=A0AA39A358_VITRO|nr:hypothetical protein PVL29_007933 [Vitis rotundifolia]